MKSTRFPKNPGKILTKALQMGLTATAYLARCRVTNTTRHLYWGGKGCKGIRQILKEGLTNYRNSVRRKEPNAKYLQIIENNVRRNHNKIVLNTSVAYGNTEERRRRRHEDRKYINTLADYFGAKIRNVGASGFLFPVPAKRDISNGAVIRYYPGNSRIPEYVPRHVAPELDFVDMIRGHGIELARQCMKYSVSTREGKRWLDRLIDQLIPYLEYVYTEGHTGKKGFIHGGVRELRGIITEMQIQHAGVNGRPQSITSEVSGQLDLGTETETTSNAADVIEIKQFESIIDDATDIVSDSETIEEDQLDTFFERILDNCDIIENPHWKAHLEKAKDFVNRGLLTKDDAKYIVKLILEDSRKRGSAFHDFIANSEFTVRPFSILGPIKYGDEMATENADLLFTCECSVADGRGRTDLLIFRRKSLERVDESPPTIVWEPFALIEIKTKSFYNLDLYATTTKSKDLKRRVVNPVLEKRISEKAEWEEIVKSTPDKYAEEQLEAYEKAVLSEYRKYVRSDFDPPQYLMKGVLVVDLAENWEVLRTNIKGLVVRAYHSSRETSLSKRQHFYPALINKEIRMGFVLFSTSEKKSTKSINNVVDFNPFSHSGYREDSREFILYLTVSGKGSPSISAAEVAAKWHGLKFIHEKTKGRHRDIVWMDFAGEYANPGLREQSLRLALQSKRIQHLVKERILFVNLSEEMSSYLHSRESIETLSTKLRQNLQEKRRPFIIVTGFDKLRDGIPRDKLFLLDSLIVWFTEQVPSQSSVLWFDRPVPTSLTSQEYDTHSVAPFYTGSPWEHVVNEIIYSVPMPPRRYGSYVPVDDDIRWIVSERELSLDYDTEPIPPLHKWGERFRPDSSREENIDRQQVFYLKTVYSSTTQSNPRHYDEEDFSSVLELIPHLKRFYERIETSDDKGNYNNGDVSLLREDLIDIPSNPLSIISRVAFTPNQSLTSIEKDGRVKRLMPLSAVNSVREYRQTRLMSEPRKETTRPPHLGLLKFQGMDKLTAVRSELSALRRIIKIIERDHGEDKDWGEFLDSLGLLLHPDLKSKDNQDDVLNALRPIHVFLETHSLSKNIWRTIKPYRTHVPDGFPDNQQSDLQNLLNKNPDLLLLVGNHLFLLLLVSLYDASATDLSTGFVRRLWNYLLPFQMAGIGFEPKYHSQHNTGRSFLHRAKLIRRLTSRAMAEKKAQRSETLDQALFGRAYLARHIKGGQSSHILLTFQTTVGSHEMNMAFLKIPLEVDISLHEALESLCKSRPFWGTSDIVLLRDLAKSVNLEGGIEIVIGSQNSTRGLWAYNSKAEKWVPIGEFEYYSRKRETVTLLTSVILREDLTLGEVPFGRVRAAPKHLGESIDIGLQLISAAFRTSIPVKCDVSLDYAERMFRISFARSTSKEEVGEILIKRTADVLEILRRPDILCEPVFIDGKQLVWNRFNDIEYDDAVRVLRMYVIRNNPLRIDSLALPENADDFCSIKKGSALKLRVRHNPYICPLRSMRLDDIPQQTEDQSSVVNYLRRMDDHPGAPEQLSIESIHRHGTCWELSFDSEGNLPDEIQELEEVKLGGPSLTSFLETGMMLCLKPNGEWVSHEVLVPESRSLPKEFRESIHLLRWRRDYAAYPGLYLLDGWIPDIQIYRSKIDFKLVSKLTLQEKTYSIIEPDAEMLGKERLQSLLKKGMNRVLEMGGFSENSTMKRLGDKEIASHLSLIDDDEGMKLQYDSVQIGRDASGEKAAVVNLVTQDNEYITIQVTQQIFTYKDWTIMAGGIDSDLIQDEVNSRLEGRNIDNETIQRIIEEVKALLEETGVVFFES